MGFFEALFDFNGNGKVDLDDDLMLMWVTQHATAEKKAREAAEKDDLTWQLLLAAAAEEEADAAKEKARKAETQRKLQHEISRIRAELYAVRVPYKPEDKEQAHTGIKQYQALMRQLNAVTPEDDGSQLYYDCIELDQEIKSAIRGAEKIYRILNGEADDEMLDPVAEKVAELATLEHELEEWEAKEPEDVCSEAWDAWDKKYSEYESQIEELRDELNFEQQEAELRDQRYLSAYTESTKSLESAQLRVERLETLAQLSKRISKEVERIVDEQLDALNSATWNLEDEESEIMSPSKQEACRKRISELKQLAERIGKIDCL